MNKIQQLTAHLRRLAEKGYIVDYNTPDELNTTLNQIDIASESQPPIDIEAMAVDDEAISEDYCISVLGFERIPHFTVNNALIYKLGRNRHLSIGDVATPNEVLFICESDKDDYRKITDLVCLHNFDYDGRMTKGKLKSILDAITNTPKNKKL